MPIIPDATLGALYALGSGLTWAVTSLLVRTLSGTLGSVAISAVRCTFGGAVLLAWILFTSGAAPLWAIRPGVLALLVLSIVVAVAIGDTVFFESIGRLGLARAMTI
ncbi:MAG TPA: EamA family transporter, partial [Methylomirabilota bacterium]|nr:EamA family transporter [Methylomirabilota bacterium]